MDRDALVKKAFELGFTYEKQYRGCSQCVIAAIQDTLDARNDFIFKAGSGLASGGGLLCVGLCGGYSGGVMVMSSYFGRVRSKFDDDREDKYCSFRMAVALYERFTEKYGSVICMDIHKNIFGRSFDLWNNTEKEAFEEAGAHTDKCTTVVADASAWSTEIILDELQKRGQSLGDFEYLQHIME
jgi:C_GCAxxG_C_C family probable redox protein